ncbi:hypothetical protein BKA65DRAFT_140110 [Rhexocercosporidium sp. MPI-PUGE-AT-0058]|nr:hypothetical protein BKA65DRAFT_140110 [Rhexocercosporidium sp. MPI-PUGE-AT-0058]
MAMEVINIFALALGGLTMIPFIDSLAADPDLPARTTNVRIAVGIDSTGLTDKAELRGNTPGLRLFDVGGNTISKSSGKKGQVHGFKDIALVADKDVGGIQGEYLSVSAGGNDPICIAYITVIRPDGIKYLWTGDVGAACDYKGYRWYESQLSINKSHDKPKCLWIDDDGLDEDTKDPNGIGFRGFGFHLTDFAPTEDRAAVYRADRDLVCESKPRFWMYPEITTDECLPYFSPPLEYKPGTMVDVDRSKVLVEGSYQNCENPILWTDKPGYRGPTKDYRSLDRSLKEKRGKPFMDGRLITSSYEGHSALNLCNSESSLGPDFVALSEGFYCDMDNKQAYPLCVVGSGDDRDACFNTTTNTIRSPQGLHNRGQLIPRKEYHTVENW